MNRPDPDAYWCFSAIEPEDAASYGWCHESAARAARADPDCNGDDGRPATVHEASDPDAFASANGYWWIIKATGPTGDVDGPAGRVTG